MKLNFDGYVKYRNKVIAAFERDLSCSLGIRKLESNKTLKGRSITISFQIEGTYNER